MIAEAFSEGTSLLHRLDPRLKVVTAALATLIIAPAQTYWAAGGGLLLALLWLALARLRWRQVGKRLLLVNGLILFLWFFVPFSLPGEAVFHLGPLNATLPGIKLAGLLTVKSNAMLIVLIALVATTPVTTLGQALHRLHLPDKFCHLLLFTYRYLYVFEQEYQRLLQAIKIRGFQPRTNVHTYRTYAYLVALLLVRSYDRAERVFQAMLCRGFHGQFYSLRRFAFHPRDVAFLAATVPCLAALVGLELMQSP